MYGCFFVFKYYVQNILIFRYEFFNKYLQKNDKSILWQIFHEINEISCFQQISVQLEQQHVLTLSKIGRLFKSSRQTSIAKSEMFFGKIASNIG
jgi:wobble nucleotide-excising tRNase